MTPGLILLILFSLADIATTYYAIITGRGREANPVMKWLFKIPIAPSLVLALLIVAVSTALIYLVNFEPLTWFASGVRGAVAYSNLLLILDKWREKQQADQGVK
jgi:hypothetical protein